MYFRFIVIFILLQVFRSLEGAEIFPNKVKRGIFGTLTTTKYKTIEEKHFVPASCIYIAPNLPDCRNVRFMSNINYPKFDSKAFFNFGNEIFGKITENDSSTTEPIKRTDHEESTTENTQGWGEYLGFYRPVVTVTELKIQPKTVIDSRIMVTYDIRGCKPHSLPFNLEKCIDDHQLELAEVLPTKTVRAVNTEPTKTLQISRMIPEDVYGSEIEVHHENVHSNTNILPNV